MNEPDMLGKWRERERERAYAAPPDSPARRLIERFPAALNHPGVDSDALIRSAIEAAAEREGMLDIINTLAPGHHSRATGGDRPRDPSSIGRTPVRLGLQSSAPERRVRFPLDRPLPMVDHVDIALATVFYVALIGAGAWWLFTP